jgi:rare lipoprotein A
MRIGATCAALALCAVGIMGCGTSAPRFRSEPSGSPVVRAIGGHQLSGIASYYADEFDGRTTASGERYDMHALTAAHRTLPFSTAVRVTNNENGRSVVVRINDRGPFKDDRVIDLSLEAAQRIGLIAKGTGPVKLEIVEWPAVPNE